MSFLVPKSRIYQYALPNKIAALGDPAGSAQKISRWQRPDVTPEAVRRHGLTWEQEEAALARVYRALRIV